MSFLISTCLLLGSLVTQGSSFTPAPALVGTTKINWSNPLENLFGGGGASPKQDDNAQERQRLKELLLEACNDESSSAEKQRPQIESIIDQLAPLSPVTATAASPLLQDKWMLQWTTEKEINFFVDVGFTNKGSIYQSIQGAVLENKIPFSRGGGLGVTGTLDIPDPEGPRTNFEFSSASLDLGRWGNYNVPPIGKGWFETIYLDEDLRVDVNSRDDILICTPAAAAAEEQ